MGALGQLARFVRAKVRNVANKIRRPSAVTAAQHRHLVHCPTCVACGSRSGGQAHHEKPYNAFPELGAEDTNFITLCESVGGPECHLHVGHGGNFKTYNPNVRADALAHAAAQSDSQRAKIVARAKAARLPDVPRKPPLAGLLLAALLPALAACSIPAPRGGSKVSASCLCRDGVAAVGTKLCGCPSTAGCGDCCSPEHCKCNPSARTR